MALNPNIPDFAQLVTSTRFLYQSKTYDTTPLSNVIVLDRAVSSWHENITVFLNKGILTPGVDYDRLDGNDVILPLYDKFATGQTSYPLIQKINIKQRVTSGSTVLIIYSVFGGDYVDYSEIYQYVMDRLTDFGMQDFINNYLVQNLDNVIETMLPIASLTKRGIIQLASITDGTSTDKAVTPDWIKNQQATQFIRIPLLDIDNGSPMIYDELHLTADTGRIIKINDVWTVPGYDYNKKSIRIDVGGTYVQPGVTYQEIAPVTGEVSTQIRWLQNIDSIYNIDIYTSKSNINNNMIVHDRLYSTHIISRSNTRPTNIIANTNWQVPSYVVGSDQLEIYFDGERVHNGISYNEVGEAGTISDFIQFVNNIVPVTEIAVYVKPQYQLISLYNKPALDDITFYVSTNGDDNNSGDSSVYPWKTWEQAKRNLSVYNLRDKKVTLVVSGKIDGDASSVSVFDVPGYNSDNFTITGNNASADGFNGTLQFEGNASASLVNITIGQIKSLGTADFKTESGLLYVGGIAGQSAILMNGNYYFTNSTVYAKNCQNIFETDIGQYVFNNIDLHSSGNITVTDSIFNIKDGKIELLNTTDLYGTMKVDAVATLRAGQIINSDFINLTTMTSWTMNRAYKFLPKTGLEYSVKVFVVVNANGSMRDTSNSLASIGGGIIKSGTGVYQIKHNLTGVKCVVTPVGTTPIIAVCDNANTTSTVRLFNTSGTATDSAFTFALS